MADYLYDGTFEGFLTCVFDHYYKEKASGIYRREAYQVSILSVYRVVATEEKKAEKVYKAIEEKISAADLRRIYRVFLSSDSEKEDKLLRYIRLGFKEGSAISLLHSNPVVLAVQQCENKVMVEMHKMLGLIRFSALKRVNRGMNGQAEHGPGHGQMNVRIKEPEILYSRIEPDHDILELVAGHFSDRLKNDPFIIHDKKRNKAVFAQNGNWYISPLSGEELSSLKESEAEYRDLWKKYFESITIRERINPGCQKRFMPVRYWKNLPEIR